MANAYAPVAMGYSSTTLHVILEQSGQSAPLWLQEIVFSGYTATSYSIHEIGSSAAYSVTKVHFTSTKILVAANNVVIKIDLSNQQYSELAFSSQLAVKDVQFLDPVNNDLSMVFVGATSSVNDGSKSQSWSQAQGFVMTTDNAEECLTYSYSYATAVAYSSLSIASYPSATTATCLESGASTLFSTGSTLDLGTDATLVS